MKDEKIRHSAWNGSFYPANPERLSKMVQELLDKQTGPEIKEKIYGIIVPHAGYEYSGATAAAAFRYIRNLPIKNIVIIAPSHAEMIDGVSVYNGDYYETPLGLVPVNRELAALLTEKRDFIHLSSAGHHLTGRAEHSLEVHLPMLQTALTQQFSIVPIVFHDYHWKICSGLGQAIAETLANIPDALLVASSDLYHGYSYTDCVKTDDDTLKAITAFAPEQFCLGSLASRYQACGAGPITAVQVAAKQLGAGTTRIVARTNSADVTGSRGGWTVGYASAVITT